MGDIRGISTFEGPADGPPTSRRRLMACLKRTACLYAPGHWQLERGAAARGRAALGGDVRELQEGRGRRRTGSRRGVCLSAKEPPPRESPS